MDWRRSDMGVLFGLLGSLAKVEETAGAGLAIALLLIIPLLVVLIYIFSGWLLYRIGKKLNYPNSWYAWIPFLNVYMMCELGEKDMTFFLLVLLFMFLCGIVSTVMLVMAWMRIAERCGKENWWGILIIIPIVNWVILYILGSGEPVPVGYPPQGYTGYPPPQQPYAPPPPPGQQPPQSITPPPPPPPPPPPQQQ